MAVRGAVPPEAESLSQTQRQNFIDLLIYHALHSVFALRFRLCIKMFELHINCQLKYTLLSIYKY